MADEKDLTTSTISISQPDSRTIGILFSGSNPIEGMKDWRKLIITMPCGGKIVFNHAGKIPEHDVPCSRGNPDHWFIKFEKTEDSNL